MFNGYGEQVAQLYAGMDLKKYLLMAAVLRKPKVLVFAVCLLPLVRLIVLGFNGGLGANPIEFITRSTGTWTLVGLMVTLSVTPLRRLTGWPS